MLLWITIPCLITGIIFVLFAVILLTRKGNTIRDILKSEKFKNQNALRIEIMNKVKISTNIPIVALFIVAFCVTFILPATYIYFSPKDITILTLSGKVHVDANQVVTLRPTNLSIDKSGIFSIPIFYSKGSQNISIEGENISPVTLTAVLDTVGNFLEVGCSNSDKSPAKIPIDFSTTVVKYPGEIRLLKKAEGSSLPKADAAPDDSIQITGSPNK